MSCVGGVGAGYQGSAGRREKARRAGRPAVMVESLMAGGGLRVAGAGRCGRDAAEAFLGTAVALAAAIEDGAGPLSKALRG